MIHKKNANQGFSGMSVEKIQFGCLLILAVVEFLIIAVGVLNPWFFSFPIEKYLVILAIIFVSVSLTSGLTRSAVRAFLTGG